MAMAPIDCAACKEPVQHAVALVSGQVLGEQWTIPVCARHVEEAAFRVVGLVHEALHKQGFRNQDFLSNGD